MNEDDNLIAHGKYLDDKVLAEREKELVEAKKAFNIAYAADENDPLYEANLKAAQNALEAAQRKRDAARAVVHENNLDDDFLDDTEDDDPSHPRAG